MFCSIILCTFYKLEIFYGLFFKFLLGAKGTVSPYHLVLCTRTLETTLTISVSKKSQGTKESQ